jgi:hypothetical protein
MKKRRPVKKIQTKPAKDTALIRECVIYAQSIAAFHDGFDADPDGNNCHATALGDRYENRAWQALTKITVTPARTPEGLCSKARIVAVVFRDNCGNCFADTEAEFLKSFAIEVKNFLQPICNGEVTIQKSEAFSAAAALAGM